jgi:hypothetical protein
MLKKLNLKRGERERAFDRKFTILREEQIEILDDINSTTPSDESKMLKTCLNCDVRGSKHMNRHFCKPECAASYYEANLELNPYKPQYRSKGGLKTKRRSYKKQQKKRSRKL